MNEHDYDKLTIGQIEKMIENGEICDSDVAEFYNNEWWDDHHDK